MSIQKTARNLYATKNDAGEGYAPDTEDIDEVVADLVNNCDGEVLCARNTSDDVAVVRCDDGEIVIIGGDAMGRNAWAVKATAGEMGIEVQL